MFQSSVLAADWPHDSYRTMKGGQIVLTSAVTQATTDWSFQAKAVRVCLNATGTADNPIYVRTGDTLSATSSANFISGGGNQGDDSAAVLTGGGAGTDSRCEIIPLVTRGLIFHATAAATIDVIAVQ